MKWFLLGLGFLMVVFPLIVYLYGDWRDLFKLGENDEAPGILIPIGGLAFIYGGYSVGKYQKKNKKDKQLK